MCKPRKQAIKPLDPEAQGAEIIAVLRRAYEVEARLLKARDFPPLARTAAMLLASKSDFYGITIAGQLAAVIELDEDESRPPEIVSLGVDPDHFRQGLATQLVSEALALKGTSLAVHTGADNVPALNLYRKLGFRLQHRYRTDDGIRMVKLAC